MKATSYDYDTISEASTVLEAKPHQEPQVSSAQLRMCYNEFYRRNETFRIAMRHVENDEEVTKDDLREIVMELHGETANAKRPSVNRKNYRPPLETGQIGKQTTTEKNLVQFQWIWFSELQNAYPTHLLSELHEQLDQHVVQSNDPLPRYVSTTNCVEQLIANLRGFHQTSHDIKLPNGNELELLKNTRRVPKLFHHVQQLRRNRMLHFHHITIGNRLTTDASKIRHGNYWRTALVRFGLLDENMNITSTGCNLLFAF